MAEKHYPFESALLEAVGEMSDTMPTTWTEDSALVPLLKANMYQNSLILTELQAIKTLLTNGIDVNTL